MRNEGKRGTTQWRVGMEEGAQVCSYIVVNDSGGERSHFHLTLEREVTEE